MQQHLVLRCAGAIASFGLLAHHAPGLSIQGTPAPERWQVNWGDQYCALVRTPAGGRPSFLLRIIPGTNNPELLLLAPDGGAPPVRAGTASLSLRPSGHGINVTVASAAGGEARAAILSGPALANLDVLAEADGIEVIQGGETRIVFRFTGARGAVAALRECVDSALSEWSIDPATLASLRQWPEFRQAWVTANDYPVSAIRSNASGTALARVNIDISGRITACAVVVSSGRPDLDGASCASATQQGRYTPAIDADGAPTAVEIIVPIRWEISG